MGKTETDPIKWRQLCKRVMADKNMMPGRGRLLIARDMRDEYLSETAKIINPDNAKEAKQTGAVLMLGPKRENAMGSEVDFVFNPGDKVLFNQFGGKPLAMHGLELVIMEESEIFLRLNADALGA